MNNFCGECGSAINRDTGLCPRCNANEVRRYYELKTAKKPETSKPKKKSKFKPVIIIITSLVLCVAVAVGVIALISFLKSGSGIEKQLESDVEVFKSNDINKINSLIMQQPEIPEELIGIFPDTQSEEDGLVADLIAFAEIEIDSYSDDTVTLNVTAPDMSGCADAVISASLSEDETMLKKSIIEYAQSAQKITTEISLDYVKKDGEFIIDYNNEDFLNAVTGNFSVAYREIYEQYINQLVQEVEEYE